MNKSNKFSPEVRERAAEISQGLYPPAPELSRPLTHSPAEEFWMIKHGPIANSR